ncbi:hypothetical protein JTE90_022832 [Oedothorax gibbosus]|uniref:Uncharacterized protein n=1 Tax=Oedothorax gibbosus TaxID=931172 RepID=A0AAV6V6Y4_9ARAC|nr:hypothetical protein JTE90_022832 [Oedothorax gibbosus]
MMAQHLLVICQLENHIKEIEIIYPVTGHSFLPPDRVFGNIENVLKRSEVVPNPEEIYKIISEFATVKIVVMNGADAPVVGQEENLLCEAAVEEPILVV